MNPRLQKAQSLLENPSRYGSHSGTKPGEAIQRLYGVVKEILDYLVEQEQKEAGDSPAMHPGPPGQQKRNVAKNN